MDKDDDKKISSTYLLHKILKQDGESKLPDEMLPLSSLKPDSLEFKKRINQENFWYLTELTNIYVINMANVRDRQIEARTRNEMLMDYHQQLEKNKKFFESLVLADRVSAEKLMLEELKKLELLNQKLDTSIVFIHNQIKLVDFAIEKADVKINELHAMIKNQNANIAALLRNYSSADILINHVKRMIVPLRLTKDELKHSPQNWSNQLILGEETVKKVINQAADAILKGNFSFENQANNMQDIARDVLKNEVWTACSFLAPEQSEKYVTRFMNTQDAALAIESLAVMVNDHIAAMDEKNNYQLKSEQQVLSDNIIELNQALLERKHLIETKNNLQKEKEALIHKKEEIKKHPNAMTGKVIDKLSDSLDDIFDNASQIQAMLESYNDKPEEKKENEDSKSTMRFT